MSTRRYTPLRINQLKSTHPKVECHNSKGYPCKRQSTRKTHSMRNKRKTATLTNVVVKVVEKTNAETETASIESIATIRRKIRKLKIAIPRPSELMKYKWMDIEPVPIKFPKNKQRKHKSVPSSSRKTKRRTPKKNNSV